MSGSSVCTPPALPPYADPPSGMAAAEPTDPMCGRAAGAGAGEGMAPARIGPAGVASTLCSQLPGPSAEHARGQDAEHLDLRLRRAMLAGDPRWRPRGRPPGEH